MTTSLFRIIATSIKRPATITSLGFIIIFLASPLVYAGNIYAPIEISLLTMLLAPLFLIINSFTKDIISHTVVRCRATRRQRTILIHAVSYSLAITIASCTVLIFYLRLTDSGIVIEAHDCLKYLLAHILYLVLIGTVHNLLTVLFNNRLIAFFATYLLVVGEYIMISSTVGSYFVFAYQSVFALIMQNNPVIYIFLFVLIELMLLIRLFFSCEEMIR